MADLKNVIYLSNEDYETLVTTGTVTVGGDTLTYDETNNVYVTPEETASATNAGLMSAADKIKLDGIAPGAGVDTNQKVAVGETVFGNNDTVFFTTTSPATITANAASKTITIGVSLGPAATQAAAGNHSHSNYVTTNTAQDITGQKTIVGQTRIKGSAPASSADNTTNGFQFWKSTTTTYSKSSTDYLGLISPNDNGYLGFYGRQGLFFRPVINNGTVDTNYGVTMESTGLFPGSEQMPLGKTSNPWGNIFGTDYHVKSNIYLTSATALQRVASFGSETASYTYTLPNQSGTLALSSQIPTGTAASKNYTTTVASGSSDVVTSGAVHAAIDNLKDFYSSVTHAELKALRDNSQLVPGAQYRITDYITTTTQTNTSSAGHQFDIIVVADNSNKLNEKARAILHTGDTYFANSKLEAWQVWYCLDNDTNRFAWADDTNGKGVIYRMIDEFGNDVPYDFKNILCTKTGKYTNAYTFSLTENNVIKDASLSKTSLCFNNIIKQYISSNKQTLNFTIFYSTNNEFNNHCNIIGYDNYDNIFGSSCTNNTIYDVFYKNVIGNNFYDNIIGVNCNNNVIGQFFFRNIIGVNFNYNNIGDRFNQNTVGINFSHNVIGNIVGTSRFGNYITRCNLGAVADNIYLVTSIFDNNLKYVHLLFAPASTTSDVIQNIHVHSGIQGTASIPKTITVDRALSYTTDIYPIGSVEKFV